MEEIPLAFAAPSLELSSPLACPPALTMSSRLSSLALARLLNLTSPTHHQHPPYHRRTLVKSPTRQDREAVAETSMGGGGDGLLSSALLLASRPEKEQESQGGAQEDLSAIQQQQQQHTFRPPPSSPNPFAAAAPQVWPLPAGRPPPTLRPRSFVLSRLVSLPAFPDNIGPEYVEPNEEMTVPGWLLEGISLSEERKEGMGEMGGGGLGKEVGRGGLLGEMRTSMPIALLRLPSPFGREKPSFLAARDPPARLMTVQATQERFRSGFYETSSFPLEQVPTPLQPSFLTAKPKGKALKALANARAMEMFRSVSATKRRAHPPLPPRVLAQPFAATRPRPPPTFIDVGRSSSSSFPLFLTPVCGSPKPPNPLNPFAVSASLPAAPLDPPLEPGRSWEATLSRTAGLKRRGLPSWLWKPSSPSPQTLPSFLNATSLSPPRRPFLPSFFAQTRLQGASKTSSIGVGPELPVGSSSWQKTKKAKDQDRRRALPTLRPRPLLQQPPSPRPSTRATPLFFQSNQPLPPPPAGKPSFLTTDSRPLRPPSSLPLLLPFLASARQTSVRPKYKKASTSPRVLALLQAKFSIQHPVPPPKQFDASSFEGISRALLQPPSPPARPRTFINYVQGIATPPRSSNVNVGLDLPPHLGLASSRVRPASSAKIPTSPRAFPSSALLGVMLGDAPFGSEVLDAAKKKSKKKQKRKGAAGDADRILPPSASSPQLSLSLDAPNPPPGQLVTSPSPPLHLSVASEFASRSSEEIRIGLNLHGWRSYARNEKESKPCSQPERRSPLFNSSHLPTPVPVSFLFQHQNPAPPSRPVAPPTPPQHLALRLGEGRLPRPSLPSAPSRTSTPPLLPFKFAFIESEQRMRRATTAEGSRINGRKKIIKERLEVWKARQSTTPTSLSELSFLTNARLHPSSTRPDPQLVAPARPPPLVRTAPLIGSTTSPSRSVMFTEFPSESGSLLQTENNGEEESEEKLFARESAPHKLGEAAGASEIEAKAQRSRPAAFFGSSAAASPSPLPSHLEPQSKTIQFTPSPHSRSLARPPFTFTPSVTMAPTQSFLMTPLHLVVPPPLKKPVRPPPLRTDSRPIVSSVPYGLLPPQLLTSPLPSTFARPPPPPRNQFSSPREPFGLLHAPEPERPPPSDVVVGVPVGRPPLASSRPSSTPNSSQQRPIPFVPRPSRLAALRFRSHTLSSPQPQPQPQPQPPPSERVRSVIATSALFDAVRRVDMLRKVSMPRMDGSGPVVGGRMGRVRRVAATKEEMGMGV